MSTLKIISHIFPASLERKVPGQGGHLRIAANSYVTTDIDTKNNYGKISLVFAHATGFHKELWNPIIKKLHKQRYRWNGGDIWTLDCSNHGDSALLNHDVLPNSFSWLDFSRDILQLIDEAKIQKPIIGIGHSFGGTSMLMAETIRPGTFASIIAIEPIIHPILSKEFKLNSTAVKKRRDRWPDRETAHAGFSMNPFFQSWDPEMLNLYVQYGLYELPSGEVALKCPKTQEYYTFFHESVIQFSSFYQLPKIQCPTLFVVGTKSTYDFKDLALLKASQCRYSEIISMDAGHLVPMEKPAQIVDIIEYFARKLSRNKGLLYKKSPEDRNVHPVLAML
ncbi:13228_t:CDS:2 [Cetraspora pellucida]|uniref:13228_t:CDS:1 n=1 Tax=Cetraspora pellucida TaxID=1433469 RepID=A0A9N8WNE3_9GLOM|nr:13228_t:CDS:2 [Cetraspora pellucida]